MFQVLISTMFLKDINFFLKTINLNSDAIIINQCDEDSVEEIFYNNNTVKLINTTTKGLSISRNLALKNATSEYCLICDDDEYLLNNVGDIIIEKFKSINADILCFKVENLSKKEFDSIEKISYLSALKVSSVQVAFKRDSIINNNIIFDEKVGAGVSAGGGEENIFLFDCLKKGLKIYKVPVYIAKLLPSVSTWKTSYNEKYFYDKGILFRKLFNFPINVLYLNYFLFSKRKLFSKDINFFKAYSSLYKGMFS